MEVLHERCAGLDVHKDVVVACVRVQSAGKPVRELKRFSTTTSGLLEMSEWLSSHGCTHVAMEATGVYWKPVWHVLEGHFELVLGNAAHMRNVPGRKSDTNDATWIADLLAHGLIRASFVPPTPVQELRDLTRTRKQLVREIAQHVQRIQKTLEDANVKLASVVSDVLGVSGRRILEAIVAGESDPSVLAALVHARVHASRDELMEALRGRITDHHRFLLKLHLQQIDALEAAVRDVEARVGDALEPFRSQVTLLLTIPGVRRTTAETIAAEIGFDMSRFPTAGHLVSWAGLCPRMDESAGKRGSTRIRKASPWLKPALVQAAWAAGRKKGTYTQAQFQRLRARRGAKKAAVAVAASLLTAAFHMLRDGSAYQDLGAGHFDRDKAKAARRLIRRLRDLGAEVDVRSGEGASLSVSF
jgi:transposase